MRKLVVKVSGEESDDRLLTLPFDVIDSDGELIAQGTTSPTNPAIIDISTTSNDIRRVYVVGTPPVGDRVQVSIELADEENEVYLPLGSSSPHEWLQWVTPFRSLSHLLSPQNSLRFAQTDRKIGRVWMTAWSFNNGNWVAADIPHDNVMSDKGVRQVLLNIPEGNHLLQVGGDNVAWRLVSLPPRGEVRVALTSSSKVDGDSIDITVGRKPALNELIMSYLSSGAIMEAQKLGDAWQAADLALFEKLNDPVSAAAGAYFLLKFKHLEDRRDWVNNLIHWFPYLADSAIVAAALALQRENSDELLVREYLNLAIERGLPLFGLGLSILVETMAAVHQGKDESHEFHAAYQKAQAYNQARCSRGAYMAFYGKSPVEPSWDRVYGLADSPETSSSSLQKKSDSLLDKSLYVIKENGFVRKAIAQNTEPSGVYKHLINRQIKDDDSYSNSNILGYVTHIDLPLLNKDLFKSKKYSIYDSNLIESSDQLSKQRVSNAFMIFGENE